MLNMGAKVFGNWTVEEKLGSGSFGTVYKIKREEFGKVYYAAMKVLKIPQDTDEQKRLRSEGMDDASISSYYGQVVQNFIREIDLLSSLDGITNIVDYKDHIIEENEDLGYTIYIKMQLLQPLSERLLSDGRSAKFLSVKEIIDIGVDICSALEVCEKHNIIHRDIKIDNIFISSNGDYKLGDFGIARQLEATQGEMSQKGTLSYMAPEVYRGENYDKTVDIYSLGLLLYRLLNKNRAPFLPEYPQPITFSSKEMANVSRLRGDAIPAVKGASEKLNAIVLKACEFAPSDRFQSATEMKKALLALDDAELVVENEGTAVLDMVEDVDEGTAVLDMIEDVDEGTAVLDMIEDVDEGTAVLDMVEDVDEGTAVLDMIEDVDEGTAVLDMIEDVDEGTAVLNMVEDVDEGTAVLDMVEDVDEGTAVLNIVEEVNPTVIPKKNETKVKNSQKQNEFATEKTVVEKIENSKVERSAGKKKSKKKVVVPIVIVLVVAIIAGVAVLLRYSRCFDCGSFIFPGTVCSWCNDTVQSDEGNEVYEVYYEYSDDDYLYSNLIPDGIEYYEEEGYYVTWYEDSNQNYLYDAIPVCTYDELLQAFGENYEISEGNDSVGAYPVSEDENLCIAYYQYRWFK